ncbi:hypothetical protein ACX0GZ_04930 [Sphingomonas aestuarii]
MDQPVAARDPQMPLPRIDPAQHRIARRYASGRLQPCSKGRCLKLLDPTARQPVSARRRDPHSGSRERHANQPNAIQPMRRIAPVEPKRRADQRARRRQDDVRRPDHPPG